MKAHPLCLKCRGMGCPNCLELYNQDIPMTTNPTPTLPSATILTPLKLTLNGTWDSADTARVLRALLRWHDEREASGQRSATTQPTDAKPSDYVAAECQEYDWEAESVAKELTRSRGDEAIAKRVGELHVKLNAAIRYLDEQRAAGQGEPLRAGDFAKYKGHVYEVRQAGSDAGREMLFVTAVDDVPDVRSIWLFRHELTRCSAPVSRVEGAAEAKPEAPKGRLVACGCYGDKDCKHCGGTGRIRFKPVAEPPSPDRDHCKHLLRWDEDCVPCRRKGQSCSNPSCHHFGGHDGACSDGKRGAERPLCAECQRPKFKVSGVWKCMVHEMSVDEYAPGAAEARPGCHHHHHRLTADCPECAPVAEPTPLVAGEPGPIEQLRRHMERAVCVKLGTEHYRATLDDFRQDCTPRLIERLFEAFDEVTDERDALKQQLELDRQLYEKDVARLEAEREPVAGEADVDTSEASYKRTTSGPVLAEAKALWSELMTELRALASTHPATEQMLGLVDAFESCGIAIERHLAERKSQLTAAKADSAEWEGMYNQERAEHLATSARAKALESALEQANARVVEVEAELERSKARAEDYKRTLETEKRGSGFALTEANARAEKLAAELETIRAAHGADETATEWVETVRRWSEDGGFDDQESGHQLFELFSEGLRDFADPSRNAESASVAALPPLPPDVEETDEPAPKLPAEFFSAIARDDDSDVAAPPVPVEALLDAAERAWEELDLADIPSLVTRKAIANARWGFRAGYLSVSEQRDAALSQVEALTKELAGVRGSLYDQRTTLMAANKRADGLQDALAASNERAGRLEAAEHKLAMAWGRYQLGDMAREEFEGVVCSMVEDEPAAPVATERAIVVGSTVRPKGGSGSATVSEIHGELCTLTYVDGTRGENIPLRILDLVADPPPTPALPSSPAIPDSSAPAPSPDTASGRLDS